MNLFKISDKIVFSELRNIKYGYLEITNQNGELFKFGNPNDPLKANLDIKKPNFTFNLIKEGSVGFAESYMKKEFETNNKIIYVTTDNAKIESDAVVLSLGSYSPILLKPLGIKLPIQPAKGYSVTIPTAGHNGAPTISITDEDHKIVFTRLGDRMRVAGTVEFNGYDTQINKKRANSISNIARSLFPNAGDYSKAELWTGLRALTPDCVPIIGPTNYQNLFVNTGHGSLGWTMCAGSGKVLSDIVSGRIPEIDISDIGLNRF